MSYFTPPTAAEVREELLMQAENYGSWFHNNAAVEAYIAPILNDVTKDVNKRIRKLVTETEWDEVDADVLAENQSLAYRLDMQLTKAEIKNNTGDPETAHEYRMMAGETWKLLEESLRGINADTTDDVSDSGGIPASSVVSVVPVW